MSNDPALLHVDSAAAGVPSDAVHQAMVAHLDRERERGAYVAAGEVEETIQRLHADLGSLVGLGADEVTLVSGATDGLVRLLSTWPLADGARVAVASSEWGTNLDLFARHGLVPAWIPVDGAGVVDVDGLDDWLGTAAPALIHLDAAASHRALVQPIAAVAEVARRRGIPVWVDAAQGVGQVDLAPAADEATADAVYGTSRKWLRGPRGAGFLAVRREWHDVLRVPSHAGAPPGVGVMARLGAGEASIAARVGLAVAVRELVAGDPGATCAELQGIGDRARDALADVPGWTLAPGDDGALAVVQPQTPVDVLDVRQRLLEHHAVLVSGCLPWRAPYDDGLLPALRVSPHVGTSDADLERVAAALARV